MIYGYAMDTLYLMNQLFGCNPEAIGFKPKNDNAIFFLMGIAQDNNPLYLCIDCDIEEDFWEKSYKDSIVSSDTAHVWNLTPDKGSHRNQIILDCFPAATVLGSATAATGTITHSMYAPLDASGRLLTLNKSDADFRRLHPRFILRASSSIAGEPVQTASANLCIAYSISDVIPLWSSFNTVVHPIKTSQGTSRQYVLTNPVGLTLETTRNTDFIRRLQPTYFYDLASPLRSYVADCLNSERSRK